MVGLRIKAPRKRKKKRFALQNCPQRLGRCVKIFIRTPRKPCSAKRKVAKVRLSTKRTVVCHIRGVAETDRHAKVFSSVLVHGGHPNDLPGVNYRIIRSSKNMLTLPPLTKRRSARSKFGIMNKARMRKLRRTRGVGFGLRMY